MKKRNLLFMTILSVFVINCRNALGPDDNGTGATVYLCGSAGYDPMTWKNGVVVVPPFHVDGGISSCIFTNKKLYKLSTCTGASNTHASVYTDGGIVHIWDSFIAHKMKLYNGKLYVAGQYRPNASSDYYAGYWIVDSDSVLSASTNYKPKRVAMNPLVTSFAYDIAMSGADVYVAGVTRNQTTGNEMASLWKNGVVQNLTDGTQHAQAQSVAVSGSDIYVAGYEYNEINGRENACLWKNGVKIKLGTTESLSSTAYCVTIDNSTPYACFIEENKPYYWKNGSSFKLPVVEEFGNAKEILVKDGIVYIAGTDLATKNNGGVCYWINGKQYIIRNSGWGECIAVE